jgi:hypothetical protein
MTTDAWLRTARGRPCPLADCPTDSGASSGCLFGCLLLIVVDRLDLRERRIQVDQLAHRPRGGDVSPLPSQPSIVGYSRSSQARRITKPRPNRSGRIYSTLERSVANHHDRDTAEIPDEEKGQSQTSQRGNRRTPKGAWIGGKFVRLTAHKKWACNTEDDALESFKARKRRQIAILSGNLQRAERELALTDPNYIELYL